MNKTIGIVGGMGPFWRPVILYQKIIQVTQADKDQEHVRVCIDGNTRIPDRTAAILHKGRDPLPQMIKSAVRLEGMGADVLIMPCNTAHYFYKKLLSFVDIPFFKYVGRDCRRSSENGYHKGRASGYRRYGEIRGVRESISRTGNFFGAACERGTGIGDGTDL